MRKASALFFLSWVVLAHAAPPAQGASSWVSVVSPLFKLRPGSLSAPTPSGASFKVLRAARGACEAFQVWVRPPALHVEVSASALEGPSGTVPLNLYREEFIDVRTPSNSQGATGLWPDALLPLPLAGEGRGEGGSYPFSTVDHPLVLYVEACAPNSQTPGRLQGILSFRARGHQDASIPITLDVEPFQIPATSSLPNTFGLSLYTVAKGHHLSPESSQARKLLRDYAAELLRHRLSAHGMSMEPPPTMFEDGRANLDFTAYDEEMAPFLDGTILPSKARFTTVEVRDNAKLTTDAERTAYYRGFADHFKARRWPQTLFFYAKDEPTPKDRPLVLEQSKRIRAAGVGAGVLVTSALDEALRPATDIFCPLLNCFFARPGHATCANVRSVEQLRQRIPPGAHIWWYQSCMSHGCEGAPSTDAGINAAYRGWASYMVDHPVPLNRAMGALAYLAGVEGELYFDVTAAYGDRDPWTDVFKFGGNGDGTLFYPGTPERLGGGVHRPVASLRLKAIRDGLQDYEYLKALERAGEGRFAQTEVRKLVRSGYDIELDPTVWERTRTELADRLRAHSTGAP
jgi:hypothetical protein